MLYYLWGANFSKMILCGFVLAPSSGPYWRWYV